MADWLLCGISVCRRLARAASACSRSIVAAVSVEVMLGPGIALIWRGVETRTDKPILIFWVCANGRSEPEAADNHTESRKVLSLYEWSSLSSRDRSIPAHVASSGDRKSVV